MKYASKDEIEHAIFKAFQEFLLAVWFFRLRLAVLLGELLDKFSLVHTGDYGAHKQTHNKYKEINVLSLSSNRRRLRYGDRNNIFGRFSNGTAKTILEMAWSDLEALGGFLAYEIIG